MAQGKDPMIMENILIKDKNYRLYIGYQDNETLRLEFNRMANMERRRSAIICYVGVIAVF